MNDLNAEILGWGAFAAAFSLILINGYCQNKYIEAEINRYKLELEEKERLRPKRILKLWEHQKGWGHNFELTIYDENRATISGFYPRWLERFQNGDKLVMKLKSGKYVIRDFCNLRFLRDPPDMFFADLCNDKYCNENGEPLEQQE